MLFWEEALRPQIMMHLQSLIFHHQDRAAILLLQLNSRLFQWPNNLSLLHLPVTLMPFLALSQLMVSTSLSLQTF